MATYSPSTFIGSYSAGDTIIPIKDTFGTIHYLINVCRFQKVTAEGTSLWFLTHASQPIKLTFSSPGQTQQALTAWQTAYESLRPNCSVVPSVVPTSPTALPITLANYVALRSANGLVPFQWYDIADTFSVFGLGSTIRALPLTDDDASPRGIALDLDVYVQINVLDNTIIYYQDPINKSLAFNKSTIINSDAVGTKTQIFANNFSIIRLLGTNTQIQANNRSTLQLDTCDNITADGSVIKLIQASRCRFSYVDADLSMFPGQVADIAVDQSNTLGKEGRQAIDVGTVSSTLNAYVDYNVIIVDLDLLSGNLTRQLANPIPNANALFKVRIISSTATPTSFTVEFQDTTTSTLFVVNDAYINSEVEFRYNKTTGLFEFIPQTIRETVKTVTITSNGQTVFASVLTPKAVSPDDSLLFVNGVQQRYSVDYTISGGDTIIWTNNSFTLDTNDVLQIKYL